ncbi:MAG: four helix bundle protein [Planctomycetota bacterium]
MDRMDHERLDVYRLALEFAHEAEQLCRGVPRGHTALADQLRRASTSICLNIAEGAGEYRSREKARFYRMARRSATECAAILDLLDVFGITTAVATTSRARRSLLLRITAMLAKGRGKAGVNEGARTPGTIIAP